LLLIALSGVVNAQSIQVRAGASYTTLFGTTGIDYTFRPAFYFGIQKDLKLSDRVAFQPGIHYSLQGGNAGGLRVALHYIQVPMNFNFRFGEKGGFTAGPQVGVLTSAKGKTKSGGKHELGTGLNVIAAGLTAGPYVKVTPRLLVDLRLFMDLMDVDPSSVYSVNNFVIQCGVTWSLHKPMDE
jgi:hypothetical protein